MRKFPYLCCVLLCLLSSSIQAEEEVEAIAEIEFDLDEPSIADVEQPTNEVVEEVIAESKEPANEFIEETVADVAQPIDEMAEEAIAEDEELEDELIEDAVADVEQPVDEVAEEAIAEEEEFVDELIEDAVADVEQPVDEVAEEAIAEEEEFIDELIDEAVADVEEPVEEFAEESIAEGEESVIDELVEEGLAEGALPEAVESVPVAAIPVESELAGTPAEELINPRKEIHGVVLLGPNTPLLTQDELKRVDELKVVNLKLPGGKKDLKYRIAEKFLGEPLNAEIISAVKAEVLRYYEDERHPFVQVHIPKQDVTLGILQLIVSESRVGSIEVEGGNFTPPNMLIGYLPAKENQPLDVGKLRRSVYFMNRNPFRRVDLVYGAGSEPYTTDISLMVEDRRPIRFYTGVDNTGVETTSRQRFFVGMNWAQALGFDHIFTYQYTSTYEVHKFQAHTGQYLALLSWGHALNLYGGYSKVSAHLPFPSSHNSGNSVQGSFRYTIPFIPGLQFTHEFTFGGDFKRTNNTIEYSQTFENIAQPVNLTQVMAQYAGSWESKYFRVDYNVEGFWSPGQWLNSQTNPDYGQLRPDAKHEWVYGRAAIKYFQRLPKGWSLFFWGRGQMSSQNLLPSEQAGIGGYDTVRGYDERQLNYDGAIILNGEIRTPAFALLGRKHHKPERDALQFLAFLDWGYGSDHNAIPGDAKGDFLLGTGPGVRYTLNPWLTSRFDWGIKLHRKPIFTGGESMVHFSVNMNI